MRSDSRLLDLNHPVIVDDISTSKFRWLVVLLIGVNMLTAALHKYIRSIRSEATTHSTPHHQTISLILIRSEFTQVTRRKIVFIE